MLRFGFMPRASKKCSENAIGFPIKLSQIKQTITMEKVIRSGNGINQVFQ